MAATRTIPVNHLRARSAAFALLARLLGSKTSVLMDGTTLTALREVLDPGREAAVLACLDRFDDVELPDPDEVAGRWVRWFDLGRAAPYEGSNIASSAGGVTPLLADVAGFYRAFGMTVSGDRPDHVVAELEFVALALLAEADATANGDDDRASIVSATVRAFLRDHLGGWIDTWAARISEIAELAPWSPIADAAAELVRAEAANRNVIPLRHVPVVPADTGLVAPDAASADCGNATRCS